MASTAHHISAAKVTSTSIAHDPELRVQLLHDTELRASRVASALALEGWQPKDARQKPWENQQKYIHQELYRDAESRHWHALWQQLWPQVSLDTAIAIRSLI